MSEADVDGQLRYIPSAVEISPENRERTTIKLPPNSGSVPKQRNPEEESSGHIVRPAHP